MTTADPFLTDVAEGRGWAPWRGLADQLGAVERAFNRARASGKATDDVRLRIFFVMALFAAAFIALAMAATNAALFSDSLRQRGELTPTRVARAVVHAALAINDDVRAALDDRADLGTLLPVIFAAAGVLRPRQGLQGVAAERDDQQDRQPQQVDDPEAADARGQEARRPHAAILHTGAAVRAAVRSLAERARGL